MHWWGLRSEKLDEHIHDRIQCLYLNTALHQIMRSVRPAEMIAAALSIIESYKLTHDETDFLGKVTEHKLKNREKIEVSLLDREHRSRADCDTLEGAKKQELNEKLIRDWVMGGPGGPVA